MTVEKATRTYRMGRRAESMEDTRRRLTEAIVELHESIGPARTTIAGIAELAGVQRHTVYRYFPTEADQIAACSVHYWDVHPWPRLDTWAAIADPAERLTRALRELYVFYADVEPMLVNCLRDAAEMPDVERAMATMGKFLAGAAKILVAGHTPERGRRKFLTAAIRHALAFGTWRSLVSEGRLSTNDAVRLMVGLVESTVDSTDGRTPK